ncbi:MAG: 1-deoxy-D-xylulose-5-phosphate reductoisomerase [Thermodesulfobacteriota bacterium]|nr:1-deoxy-D-xylulose-5-phosphate reductoisomerase [Thermodesulfobacteriota bacterium]
MKNIAILGSTGSIGVQTLDVIRLHKNTLKVVGLAAGEKLDLLERQVREFEPAVVSCSTQVIAATLEQRLSDLIQRPHIGYGIDGAQLVATWGSCDLVVGGLPGSVGLRPTFAAVDAGKDVALATKEVLVMAGDLFMHAVASKGVRLLPVDSEQSAIFQCIQGNKSEGIRRIILTASGGPFRDTPMQEMHSISVEQALDHPRWKMGPKVTIDSATLMNKGLEVIEARWLFEVPVSRIEVLLHPESIVHSMVEFDDGAIMAQLGAPDMRIPISYALAYPDRIASGSAAVDFPRLGRLTFHEPDTNKFPLLAAAYDILRDPDPSSSIVFNAADEVAVDLFLRKRIPFGEISNIVLDAMQRVPGASIRSLDDVEAFHQEVVRIVKAQHEA